MTNKCHVNALQTIANHDLHPFGFKVKILYRLDRSDQEHIQSTLTRIADGFSQMSPLHHNIADARQSLLLAVGNVVQR